MQQSGKGGSIARAIDSYSYQFARLVVPAIVIAISVVAWLTWQDAYPEGKPAEISFRMLEETSGQLSPTEAAGRLAATEPLLGFATQLSERPFWFGFDAPQTGGLVEMPSRHMQDVACWGKGGEQSLGSANKHNPSGLLEAQKAGFTLQLTGEAHGAIVCRATFVGPARMNLRAWNEKQFAASALHFQRSAGLLDGGLVLLSVFVMMVGVINREWIYVMFGSWLIANLRMGALSAGWDYEWLDKLIPLTALAAFRALTITAYYSLTVILFTYLFKDDLRTIGYRRLTLLLCGSCIPVLAAAIVLPYGRFLPVIWVVSSFTILALGFLLARILLITRSMVAVWTAAAFAIALFSSLYEVIAAAAGSKVVGFSSVTAALFTSLMVALAIAEQIRTDRLQRIRAQQEVRDTYDAIPIGLFTLDDAGYFIRFNPALAQMLHRPAQELGSSHFNDHFQQVLWYEVRDELVRSGTIEMELDGVEQGGHTRGAT